MGFNGISKLNKKRNRIYLVIVVWLIIGIFISAFRPGIAFLILNPLIGFCVALFILSLFIDLRDMTLTQAIIVLVISIVLAINLFIFREIIGFFFFLAIVSYIIITGLFSLWGCFEGAKDVDEYLYNRSSPLNHILRFIEFVGGLMLGLYIVTFAFLFTGARLVIIYQIVFWTLVILGLFCVIFLIFGRFNAWLGTFSIYAGVYFLYLVVVFLFGPQIYDQPNVNPFLIRLIFAILDVIILLYTIGILIGKRAELISKKIKLFKADTILIWLIFSKAAYELAIINNPGLVSDKNWWVLTIFIFLLGIVGVLGIATYKKYRKKRKK